MKISGVVSAVSPKGDKYGIKIDDSWYNGFGSPGCDKGDTVEVIFDKNGNFNNVTKIDVLHKGDGQTNTQNRYQSGQSNDRQSRIDEATRKRRRTDVVLKCMDAWIADKIEKEQLADVADGLITYIEEQE